MATRTEQLSAIARCCRNSAAMLRIADHSEPDLDKRKRFKEANCGQAAYLDKAADMADELAQSFELVA